MTAPVATGVGADPGYRGRDHPVAGRKRHVEDLLQVGPREHVVQDRRPLLCLRSWWSRWGGAVECSFTINVIVTSAFLYGTWTGKPLPKNKA